MKDDKPAAAAAAEGAAAAAAAEAEKPEPEKAEEKKEPVSWRLAGISRLVFRAKRKSRPRKRWASRPHLYLDKP